MTISTSCPGCKSKYNVADSMAGKKAKCKKCGAILAIPNPVDPVLAETSEPVLADLAGSSPLDGLTDRDLGGDPLGPSPLSPGRKPAGTAARRPAPSPGGGGVPKVVWIAGGVGGGVCLLLLVLILVFGGSSDKSAPPVASDGGPATGGTPIAAAPSADAPAADPRWAPVGHESRQAVSRQADFHVSRAEVTIGTVGRAIIEHSPYQVER